MQSIADTDYMNLQLGSTLQDIPIWSVYVEQDRPGHELATLFEQEPLLPGIILTKKQQYQGMISRRLFFEQMSRPYGLGLFSGRSIKSLYEFLKPQVFIISEDTTVVKATQIALRRARQDVYEPLLVKTNSLRHGIIDFHHLLLAYSEIQMLTLAQLQREEAEAKITKREYLQLQDHYHRLLKTDTMLLILLGMCHTKSPEIFHDYSISQD